LIARRFVFAFPIVIAVTMMMPPVAGAQSAAPLSSPMPASPSPHGQRSDLPLPDPALTPGDIASDDIKDVCFPGYDQDQGYLTPEDVRKTFDEYHVTTIQRQHRFVVDRLVPASLGGSGELRNLWAMPLEAIRRKRFIEQTLQEQVCSGNISLAEAQRRMITDWRAAVTW
jgi:hypothetical protein